MAWIELHQAIWTHRKTFELAAALDLDETYAAAHLIRLWTWCIDNAPDGDLSTVSDRAIAFGSGWRQDAESYVRALTSSGWLDDDRQIHDWAEYGGKLVERRRADAERKRNSAPTNKESERSSNGSPADVQRNSGVHNKTVDNKTEQNTTGEIHPPSSDESALSRDDDDDAMARAEASEIAQAPDTERPFVFALSNLTEPAREFIGVFRHEFGRRAPPKLNRAQVKLVEEAVLDLGLERLSEAAHWAAEKGLDYGGGGVVQTIRGARTKRQRDEEGIQPERRPTNGRIHQPEHRAAGASAPKQDLSAFAQFSGLGGRQPGVAAAAAADRGLPRGVGAGSS